ncbi:MAG: class I SAM-dependent methyltransferase, partial [Treponema sp.]|nr:class I SAM-dependent methyltransferase [Treponema sp.]
SLLEIAKFERDHGELPFSYSGDNWVYDAFCEYQKRSGVIYSQFLTPAATVDRMLHFAGKYFKNNDVLEPCCGTGQITKELLKNEYAVTAFDIDAEMVEFINFQYPELNARVCDFKIYEGNHNQIIANPPYELPELSAFLQWVLDIQTSGGISVLLLPKGFVEKTKPKALVSTLHQLSVQEKEDMRESFLRTSTSAEIVVLKKL